MVNRGDRVTVDYSGRKWPDNVVYPHGWCGYVQEVFGPRCAVQVDGQPDRCEWVDAKYLTVIVTEAEASERTAP